MSSPSFLSFSYSECEGRGVGEGGRKGDPQLLYDELEHKKSPKFLLYLNLHFSKKKLGSKKFVTQVSIYWNYGGI